MTHLRTLMPTGQFLFAWHSAAWDGVSAALSIKLRDHHQLIASTMTSFFEARESFYMVRIVLRDNLAHIYGTHMIVIFNTQLHRHKNFKYSQQHLHSFHRNMILNVSSYKESITHNDSFFRIYAFHILRTFNIFYRIGKLLSLHYIWPFFQFSRNYIWLLTLHDHRGDICHYGRVEGISEGNKFHVFFGKVCHRSVARDPYHIRDFWISHKNNNTRAYFNCTQFYIECSSSWLKISSHLQAYSRWFSWSIA